MADAPVVDLPVVDAPVLTDTPVVDAPVVEESDDTLLSNTEQDVTAPKSDAPKVEETPEQKTAREATETENKRLLEADDKTLKPEELAKKQELIKAKENTVPEKYEVKIEGVEINQGILDEMTPIFKEAKLTNAQVQKLAEIQTKHTKVQVEAQQKAAIDMWNKQGDDWKKESVTMLGANAKTDMAFAGKFMDRFGGKKVEVTDAKGNKVQTNELRILMQDTKIGNNPIMLKAIIEAGKLLGEDKFVEGSNVLKGETESIYDHPTSKATLKYK